MTGPSRRSGRQIDDTPDSPWRCRPVKSNLYAVAVEGLARQIYWNIRHRTAAGAPALGPTSPSGRRNSHIPCAVSL